MKQNLVYIVAGIAVIGLVGFSVFRSTHRPAPQPESVAAAPAASPAESTPQPDTAPRIEPQELKALLDKSGATVIDVRDSDSYLNAHLPGSLQIPVTRVEAEVPYLPKGKPIVTYCTCPHDELAIEAVQILQHAGVADARVLRGGLQAWMSLGYGVTSGMK